MIIRICFKPLNAQRHALDCITEQLRLFWCGAVIHMRISGINALSVTYAEGLQ